MDYWYQAEVAVEYIGTCLETIQGISPDLQGAYTILKWCYHHASLRQPNTSRADIYKVSGEYAALYQQ